MASVSSIKSDITTLSDYQLQELFNYIGEMLTLGSLKGSLNNDFKESRFSKGEICPHCQSTSIVKNGKLNGKQRYLCKSCKKSFNDLTKSALSSTKLPLEKWIEYVKGMILGLSIRKNAENIDVCVKTSFYMRHKVLDCIRAFMGIGDVDGIVEMDETFVPISYKGNQNKSGFKMPRPARKRGKQIKKRGISNEQVCIATAIDRNGNIILEPICTGRISHKDLELNHKRIMRGHYKNGIYHINHINSLHSKLKIWMYRFKGVSSKFLSNYMTWYKWLETFNDEKDIIRTKNMLIHSVIPFVDTKIKGYRDRNNNFI